MARMIKELTDAAVRNIKPDATKQKTLFDGKGLFLLISPKGGKWWRFKYQFNGKTNIISFGTYPEVSLGDARDKRDAARKQIAAGIDPGELRKAKKAATVIEAENAFEVVAREWHSKFFATMSASHAKTTMGRLQLDVFPAMGARPIGEIKAPELLTMLRRIESRGALETAHRVRTICGQIFRYAVATGRAERDPSADLKGALPPYKKGHHAAITNPKEVAPLLRAIDGYEGTFVVKSALQLAPLVFARPGELRQAEWAGVDFDAAEWRYLVTKTKTLHIVPLSKQAVAILLELRQITGASRYVFPNGRSFARPMSDNAINAALRRMGFSKDEMTAHGFRAMARTILDEVSQERVDFIEHQLAHAVKDPNGRAYNRTSFLPERREMMQKWADYLDELKTGAKVLPFKSAVAI